MNSSKFLAKVMGLYLVIVSLGLLCNMQHFNLYIQHLMHDESALWISGFFTLILGILLVVSHNIWKWHWSVIITIFAWLCLIKGLSLINYPQAIDKITTLYLQNSYIAYSAGIVDFLLGIILCYFGFRKSNN